MGINKLYVVTAAKSDPGQNVLRKGRAGYSLLGGSRKEEGRRPRDGYSGGFYSASFLEVLYHSLVTFGEAFFILSEKVKMPVMR